MKELLTQPLIWMALLPRLSGLPSPSSTLLLSLHCKIVPKVFIASKTSTPCVPPSLSFLKHILHPIAHQMLSEFLACIQHGALGSGDTEGNNVCFTDIPVYWEMAGKTQHLKQWAHGQGADQVCPCRPE